MSGTDEVLILDADPNCVSTDSLSIMAILDLFPRAPTHSPKAGPSPAVSASSTADLAMTSHSHASSKSQLAFNAIKATKRRMSSFLQSRTSFGSGVLAPSGPALSMTSVHAASGSSLTIAKSTLTVQSPAGRLLSNMTTVSAGSIKTSDNSLSCTKPAYSSQSDGMVDDRLTYTVPSSISDDRDYVDILKRAAKNLIAPKEQELLFQFLLSLSPSKILVMQRAIHELLTEKTPIVSSKKGKGILTDAFSKPQSNLITVEVNKYNLDFGMKGKRVKVNEEIHDVLKIDLKAGKAKYSFRMPKFKSTGYVLRLNPAQGKLKPGCEEIQVSLVIKRPIVISEVIVLEIDDGLLHFITLKISSEWSNFGADLADYVTVRDEVIPGIVRMVPEPLVQLRSMLMARNGLEVEEIFRKQVADEEVVSARLNFDQFSTSADLSATMISTLIKVWFRELPQKLFDVNVKDVITCDSEEKSIDFFTEKIAGHGREVALWVFDLMVKILEFKDVNRMSSKKLGIVMAPNLFPQNIGGTNPECLRRQAEILTYNVDHHAKTLGSK